MRQELETLHGTDDEEISLPSSTFYKSIRPNCSRYFTALKCINNLETKRSYKRKVKLKNLKFF